jgi:protein-S-isoprenylcysteine O-methyltransferase Ste14
VLHSETAALNCDAKMFTLARAVTYSTFFVGLVLIFLPASVLTRAGVVRPAAIGVWQVAGVVVGLVGAALALWCILTFVFIGHGTPAPFDPPRRLVVRGPYRLVRNPMYIGAGIALFGAALFYQSPALLGYVVVFLLAMHVFVIGYEEPTLRRMFGREYTVYCQNVGRWWPGY